MTHIDTSREPVIQPAHETEEEKALMKDAVRLRALAESDFMWGNGLICAALSIASIIHYKAPILSGTLLAILPFVSLGGAGLFFFYRAKNRRDKADSYHCEANRQHRLRWEPFLEAEQRQAD